MANKNVNPYARKRRKAQKVVDTNETPFKKELDNKRNNKVIYFVIGLIILVMVGGMIFPYLSGSKTKNYSLPTNVLEGNDAQSEVVYVPNQISVGQSLTRVDKEYYVLFGQTEEISDLSTTLTKLPLYMVEKDRSINNSLVKDVDEAKKNELPKTTKDIKIYDKVTLIKVKDGKVIDYVHGKSEIEKYAKK
ncbi:MAG: hypothetical protein RR543_02855 [Erysipelotrichales bacterium]